MEPSDVAVGRQRARLPGALARGGAVIALLLMAAGCDLGGATLRIDRAEGLVLEAVVAVTAAVGLPTADVRLVGRTPCTTVTGASGLRNGVRVRGPVRDGTDVGEVAAETLAGVGFEPVASELPGTVLATRDGMRVTVAVAERGIEIDGSTACRPAER